MDPEKIDPIIGELIQIHPEFNNIGLRHVNGESIFSSLKNASSPTVVKTFPWFQDGIHNDRFMVGNVFFGRLVSRWVSVLTFPVHGVKGAIAGFLNMPLDLSKLNARLFKASPPNAVSSVLDRELNVALRSSQADAYLGKPAPAALRVHMQGVSEGAFIATEADGIERLYPFVSIPDVGWRVIVQTPKAQAYDQFYASYKFAVLLAMVVQVLALAMAWRIGAYVVEPISELVGTAARVASGDVTARAVLVGPSEIESVAQQFNLMLDARDKAAHEIQLNRSRDSRREIENQKCDRWPRCSTQYCFRQTSSKRV